MNRIQRRLRTLLATSGAAALLWAVAAPPTAAAQDGVPGALLAVLRDARESLPRGVVTLDPTPICTARLIGWSCPEQVRPVLDSLEVDLGSRAFSYVCPTSRSGCRLLGTDVLVQLSAPDLSGGGAEVWMDVWWRGSDPERSVEHSRTRYQLARRGGRWRVTAREPHVGG